ncbi:uncharacterized protein [Clytia hemisphaerica]|uniref:C2H2-type domain-containing protein n=1 Tax=Clytia hemisphaerica TaxID=252671 RepID=A0A7M5VFD6_9CNID
MSFNNGRQFHNNDNRFGTRQSPDWRNQNQNNRGNFDLLGSLGFGNFQNFDRVGNFDRPLDFHNRPTGNFNRPGGNFEQGGHYPRHNDRPVGQYRDFDRFAPPEKRMRNEPPMRRFDDNFSPSFHNHQASPRQGNPPQKGPKPRNSFEKFNNIEEFKEHRRHLQERKSLEERRDSEPNRETDSEFIFIGPNDIKELKDDIYLALRRKPSDSVEEVSEICRVFSRLQFHLSFRDYSEAKEYSKKKSQPPKQSTFYSCKNCDCYFSTPNVLDIHVNTKFHQQVSKIYNEVAIIGKEYLQVYEKPATFQINTPISEKVGILVCLKEEKIDLAQLDVKKLDENAFVLAALEKRMAFLWPHPKSQYFCRCCNYSEFPNQAMLDRHQKSARHLDFDRHYNEAFCIVCQYHYGDETKMKEHQKTKEHDKASHLMDFTKKQASEYWKYWHNKDEKDIPKNQSVVVNGSTNEQIERIKQECVLIKGDSYEKKDESTSLRVPFVETSEASKSSLKHLEDCSTAVSPQKSNQISTTTDSSHGVVDLTSPVKNPRSNTAESLVIPGSITNTPPSETIACSETENKININENQDENKPKDTAELDIEKYKEYVFQKNTTPTKLVEDEKPAVEVKEENEFDEYIVPLTGYMCTVCHETLADKEEAKSHKDTNGHKSKVKTHELLFG